MEVNKVVFFSTWHNGDIFSSKEFVKDLAMQLQSHGLEVAYAANKPKEVINLNIEYENIEKYFGLLDINSPFAFFDNTLFIGTWVGFYPRGPGHNYASQIQMWSIIANKIEEVTNIKIHLKNVYDYVSRIETDLIRDIDIPKGKKVLICNVRPFSSQSFLDGYDEITQSLANEFEDILFICAHKFQTNSPNIIWTDDITGRINNSDGFDLAEIGYLSEFCNLIVTNSSGPGTFSMTRNNFDNPNMKIIAFVGHEGHTFWNGLEYYIKADCLWSNTTNMQEAYEIIKKKIMEIK